MASKPVVKRRPKTLKEKRFVAELISNGGNASKAALVAYDTDEVTARSLASQTLAKLNISSELEKAGFTITHASKKIFEASNANKIHGTADDFIEVDDHPTRLKAVELGLKLMGVMNQDTGTTQNFFQYIQNNKNEYNI